MTNLEIFVLIVIIILSAIFFGLPMLKMYKNQKSIDTLEIEDTTKKPRAITVERNKSNILAKTAYKERRKFPRQDFQSLVNFVINGKGFKATSANLSKAGIFLKSKNQNAYKVDDRLTIALQMPDRQPLKHAGQIIRKDKDGIGIQFGRF
ncbi:MAG: PilZ domain-containing protein [Desulfobacteraceae bacterium]|nr:PilZ domain-containing protein [Desulfobacteraceae bacterium]